MDGLFALPPSGVNPETVKVEMLSCPGNEASSGVVGVIGSCSNLRLLCEKRATFRIAEVTIRLYSAVTN